MGRHRFFIVDVFAEGKYAGNPLAVVACERPIPDSEMQRIARETNFSETTFVAPGPPGADGWAVRIFTPGAELPFAGHPTLGTAHVIRAELDPEGTGPIVLAIRIGPVPVTREAAPDGGEVLWMRAPSPVLGETRPPEPAARMLGLSPGDIDTRFPVREVKAGVAFLMVPLAGLDALRRCRIDSSRRAALLEEGVAAGFVYPFSRETRDPANHVAARMFFDANGLREDPATGGAAVCLGGYLLGERYFGGGPVNARVEQGHDMGRPSLLLVRAEWESGAPRVSVGGRVIPVARGELL